MDLGAAWTPHIDLAVMLLLRCSLEARSNSMGTWRSRKECTARASTSKIVMVRAQYALRGSCLRTFWFSLWSIPACLRCHVAGFLRCHVVRKIWAAQSTPANPQPPRVVLPAELNCRGACEMFQFVCKREFVSWACMVDGSHKKREGGCFFGD